MKWDFMHSSAHAANDSGIPRAQTHTHTCIEVQFIRCQCVTDTLIQLWYKFDQSKSSNGVRVCCCFWWYAANMRRNAKIRNAIISMCIAHLIACHFQPASGYREYTLCILFTLSSIAWEYVRCIYCNAIIMETKCDFLFAYVLCSSMSTQLVNISTNLVETALLSNLISISHCIEFEFSQAKHRHEIECERWVGSYELRTSEYVWCAARVLCRNEFTHANIIN